MVLYITLECEHRFILFYDIDIQTRTIPIVFEQMVNCEECHFD